MSANDPKPTFRDALPLGRAPSSKGQQRCRAALQGNPISRSRVWLKDAGNRLVLTV